MDNRVVKVAATPDRLTQGSRPVLARHRAVTPSNAHLPPEEMQHLQLPKHRH